MIKVVQRQHSGTIFRLAWDLSIIGIDSIATLGDELISTREDHSGLPFGFGDSLMAWETSSAWQVRQQEDVREAHVRETSSP